LFELEFFFPWFFVGTGFIFSGGKKDIKIRGMGCVVSRTTSVFGMGQQKIEGI
jgi:hypothetical protein